MNTRSFNSRIVSILRWVARIWSMVTLLIALMVAITPDPYVVKPMPLSDWIELGFLGLSLFGLVLAWRREGSGGAIAIAGVAGNQIAFRAERGMWNFNLLLAPGMLFIIPGVLFLACFLQTRRRRDSIIDEGHPKNNE